MKEVYIGCEDEQKRRELCCLLLELGYEVVVKKIESGTFVVFKTFDLNIKD